VPRKQDLNVSARREWEESPCTAVRSRFDRCSYVALIHDAPQLWGHARSARTPRRFRNTGADIGINYRSKGARAQEIADDVAVSEQQALLQADITTAMFTRIKAAWKKLDFLILNASGGREQGKAADYTTQLNLLHR
jgi:hypothetical protein